MIWANNNLNIMKNKKNACMHDYKNAIQVGNVDYMCPLCKRLLNPFEWFLMNNFKFVDVGVVEEKNVKSRKKSNKK